MARIRTKKFANRDVIQIFYENEPETLKALRKLFMYSYATTINKTRSNLKELMELVPQNGNAFKIRTLARNKSDFDAMFNFLEDKNLFDYWKAYKSHREQKSFFIDYSRRWIPVRELANYRNRTNVIYLLYHSRTKCLYVGKANRLGDRVVRGQGRVGLRKDWDRFMFFEIHPEFNQLIEQIESFLIRTFASIIENEVKMVPLGDNRIRLVNRQLLTH